MAGSVASLIGSSIVLPASADDEESFKVFKMPSGLQYIELVEGTKGESPRYGQLCSIKYTGYVKLPDADKVKFDQSVFLVKHGNAKTIMGIDEGLHSMKVGGKRRLIIPPKLGFVDVGLGPVPVSPFARDKLNYLLDKMVEKRTGRLIYDVELVGIIDNEADQGYYEDTALTNEQFDTLRENLQQQVRENQALRKQQNQSNGEDPLAGL